MSTHQFNLNLLNGFALRQGAKPVPTPSTAKRVLAYLAVHGPSSRAVVAGELWPEVTEGRADGSLRSTLWRLGRRSHDLVRCHADVLSLGEPVEVDVDELDRAARAVLDGEPIGAAGQAVVLRGGDLLPDWAEQWVVIERERLRQLRLHALDALAEQLCARGGYPEALAAAMQAVDVEPLRESGHRALIMIYLASGSPGHALDHYESYRTMLRTVLGLEPSARMRTLLSRGVRDTPDVRAADPG
ncbi:hypothetical protein GCM10010174_37330 [Kutzneria viridogrisea]|uniref:Bacterial transcriptional activator domain-containing protein n=2 Tax=Kutzneria TaxID=43356 RepID=W5W956_9PSEU|nr:BTAD domain-containing putative transcriptional regulator [Kutzneria albida]AHH94714.1 hypothetical protein KALB_1341 [Kutzneria albida DSM 43870]MBA8930382.1 DNA-binding SARP family transcriptional activator [Kutzneria viridogrisea]